MKVLRLNGGQLLGKDVFEQLCSAVAAGDLLRVKALIENGANPDAGDYDLGTALYLAASNGKASVLEYLLRHLHNIDGGSRKLNVNALDRLDSMPLEDASGTVELLLSPCCKSTVACARATRSWWLLKSSR